MWFIVCEGVNRTYHFDWFFIEKKILKHILKMYKYIFPEYERCLAPALVGDKRGDCAFLNDELVIYILEHEVFLL